MYKSSKASSSSSPSQHASVEDQLRQALAGLQLPHMPAHESTGEPDLSGVRLMDKDTTLKNPSTRSSLPTIRILVVADIDLPSASWLAEYTLQQQRNNIFDARRIDLCIACGSFCRDDDLAPYQSLANQQQKARRIHMMMTSAASCASATGTTATATGDNKDSSNNNANANNASLSQQQQHQQWCFQNTPFFRSREETAALEGLMTAALSQLESIVCRVIYCPGATDPLTTLVSSSSTSTSCNNNSNTAARRTAEHASFPFSIPPPPPIQQHHQSSSSSSTAAREQQRRASSESFRLTPNSRNIHQQWLPMAPGLGCAGLLYLESPEKVVNVRKNMTSNRRGSGYGGSSGDGRRRLHRNTRAGGGGGLGGALTDDVDDDATSDNDDEEDDDDDFDDDDAANGAAAPPQQDSMMILAEQLVSIQQSSEGYCSTLSRLLQLAPPPPTQHPAVFSTERSQSILVTHYVDLDAPRSAATDDHDDKNIDNHDDIDDNDCLDYDDAAAAAAAANGSPSWAIEHRDLPRDLPFPMKDHDLFIKSMLAQQMLCLEIASGSATFRRARLVKKGRAHLLLPGSLRKRGEFSIVDLCLAPDDGDDEDSTVIDTNHHDSNDGAANPAAVFAKEEEDEVDRTSPSQYRKTTMSASSSCRLKAPRYRWTVSNVEFHNVNNLP